MWSICVMLHVRESALTRGAPRVDVETFSSWQPVLADFLWASRYKLESLTVAFVAIVLDTAILQEGFLVIFKKMAAEASRV